MCMPKRNLFGIKISYKGLRKDWEWPLKLDGSFDVVPSRQKPKIKVVLEPRSFFPLENLPLWKGAAAVKASGDGVCSWKGRSRVEQEAMQTVQLREKGVTQSFHTHSLCFRIDEENVPFKKNQPDRPRFSTEKQMRFLSGLYLLSLFI